MVTQVMIAERAGVDVSSVNKILNEKRGPVFRKETIRMVRKVARELGYQPNPRRKKALFDFLERLFPRDVPDISLVVRRNVTLEVVAEARALLGHKPVRS